MKKQFQIFVIRWLLNAAGLWVAFQLLGSGYRSVEPHITILGLLFASLLFSIVNSLLRPIIVILSLPAILLSLGLFILVINGLMVYISLKLAPGFSMTFFNSILTGILLSLINYIVSTVMSVRANNNDY